MKPRRIFAITKRLLIQFRRDHRTLALLFVAPIVILALLGYLMRGGGSLPALGMVNQDTGPLGAAVVEQLKSSNLVTASVIPAGGADDRLRRGDLAGYVLIPSDFTKRALGERILAYDIHLEGSQPGLNQQLLGAVAQSLPKALGAVTGSAIPKPAPNVTYSRGGAALDQLDYFGAAFIGLVVFFLVFVITSVSFLRERTQGTLERLMASPLRRSEIVLGYMSCFGAVALLQSLVVMLFSLYVLRVHNSGNPGLVFLIETLMAVAAVNLGIFLSMFARTEFQAVQFIPLVIVPQMLLAGIIFPISSEPRVLQYISEALPLTYGVYGLRDVMLGGAGLESTSLLLDIAVLVAFCVLAAAAASLTLRRRIA